METIKVKKHDVRSQRTEEIKRGVKKPEPRIEKMDKPPIKVEKKKED